MSDEPRCDACRWGNPITIRGNVVGRVQCRRYPPSRQEISGYSKFIVVEQADWCGEFLKKM